MIGINSNTSTIWPALVSVPLLLALSVYSWRRRSLPGALPFTIGCLFTTFWAIGFLMLNSTLNITSRVFWIKFSAIWQLPATTAITCFFLEYAWPGRWLTRRNLILLSIAPLLSLVFIVTNDLHYLFWAGLPVNILDKSLFGPAIWIFIIYSYAWALINITVLIWLFIHSAQHRWPVVIMILAEIVSRTMMLLDSAQVKAWFFNVPVFALPFLAYAIALFAFRLLDPVPLARQTAFDQLHVGMLVLDLKGRVSSLNPAAEQILGITASHARGKLVKGLLPVDLDGTLSDSGMIEIDLSPGTGQKTRHYTLEISLLKDFRGLKVGSLLMLRDVTEQKQAHDQIIEQQRALAMLHERERLARELHDSLGQVLAFVNTQGQTVRRMLARNDLSKADEYVARLVEVAREADIDIRESILGLRETLSEHGFLPALEQYLERYERNYEIHTELNWPETLNEAIFEPQVEMQLLRIMQEALTNARKHANASCVQVSFTVQNGRAQIIIQDDGQGFEAQEPSMSSTERVGLRVMRERAEEVGGILRVESSPGNGTRVLVEVPVKKDAGTR